MLAHDRLANVSFFISSVGQLGILAILAGILDGVITDDPNSNTRALSIVCAYSAGMWSDSLYSPADIPVVDDAVLLAIPWLAWEQYRPGNQLPPRTTYFTVG